MKHGTSWQTRYPGFGWSIRPDLTTRTVTAVAIAGLVGTMIGGFSAFGVLSALTPPPREDGAAAAPASPIRTIYGAVPDPSAGMTAGAPVQAPPAAPAQPQIAQPPQQQPMTSAQGQSAAQGQSIATPPPQSAPVAATVAPQTPAQSPAQPPQSAQAQTAPAVQGPQKTWPDALSHSRSGPSATTEAAAPPSTAPGASKDDAAKVDAAAKDNDNRAATTGAAAEPQHRTYARKRVVNSRKPQPAMDANAGDTPQRNARPVYDYFWGHTRHAEQDDDADSSGTALSGMKPPRTGRAIRNEVSKSRYVHGRRAPADADDAQDTPQRPDDRRDSYEERDRGGGRFFGRSHWHEDDND
jgi:hypothetical protein